MGLLGENVDNFIKKKKCCGEITIFLTLLLLIMLSFLSVVIQSASQEMRKTYCERDAKTCVQSLFTEYARPLWEQYHLFMLEGEEEEVSYMEQRMGTYHGSISGPFFQESSHSITVTGVTRFLNEDGSNYLKEIKEYMIYHAPRKALEDMWGDKENTEKAQKTQQLLEKKSELDEKLGEMDRSVMKAISLIEGIEIKNGKINKNYIFVKKMVPGAINAASVGVRNSLIWEALEGSYITFEEGSISMCQSLQSTISKALQEIEKIEKKRSTLQTDVNAYRSYFEQNKSEIMEEVSESLTEDLDKISQYSNVQSQEGNLSGQLIRMKGTLESNALVLEAYIKSVEQEKAKQKDTKSKDKKQKNTKSKNTKQNDIASPNPNQILLGYQVSSLQFDYGQLEIKGEKSPLETLEKKMSGGILKMIVEDPTVIGKKLYPPPYVLTEGKKENILETGIDVALELEYYQMHFRNFCSEKKAGEKLVSCEQEYLAVGGNTEEEVLEKYISRLLLERTTCNFLYLLKDRERNRQAYLAAVGLVGYSCMEPLIQAAKYSILMGWATAEGMVDVAILLRGGEVAFWKTQGMFQLSFQELFAFRRELIQEKAQKAMSYKLTGAKDYEDYLKSILLFQKRELRLGRSLGVIERNMKESYAKDFSISKGIFGITMIEEIDFKDEEEIQRGISYSY